MCVADEFHFENNVYITIYALHFTYDTSFDHDKISLLMTRGYIETDL